MSSALSAEKHGLKKILILEKRSYLGGLLRQCIHDGFGVVSFGRSLTGPNFSRIFEDKIKSTNAISYKTSCFVESINYDISPFEISFLSSEEISHIRAKSIIIATGSREKSIGSMRIPGTRPAGIFSAGACQYMMNIKNMRPGSSAVILGLGDIGLIMARRLCLEGIKVKMAVGLELTGQQRNFESSINDFKIPYRLGYGVCSVHGMKRLKGVSIAPISKDGCFDMSKKEYIPCDTLLVATGLEGERELCPKKETKGVFLCGNVDRIFPLADFVCYQGELMGALSCEFVLGKFKELDFAISLAQKNLNESESLNQDGNCPIKAKNKFICLGCPKSCQVEMAKKGNETIFIGNKCKRGEELFLASISGEKRILTTTVKKDDGSLFPVRSDVAIPKELLTSAVKEINKLTVSDEDIKKNIIIKNILGLDANIIV